MRKICIIEGLKFVGKIEMRKIYLIPIYESKHVANNPPIIS
jgi:hypothetical protein